MIPKKKTKRIILLAVAVVLIIAAAAGLWYWKNTSGKEQSTEVEDVKVTTVDMERTLTAAGEVVPCKEEKISFSTSKYYSGMCVEVNETVKAGQHLIAYSDGTYTDAEKDGSILSISAPKTGTVADDDNFLMFTSVNKYRLDITVPESEINQLSKGGTAKITINADPSKTYEGTIVSTKAISTTLLSSDSDSSDSSSGKFNVKNSASYYSVSLEFENDGNIRRGMSAVCTVVLSHKDDVMAVPVEAVQYDGDQAYVLVVSGDKTEKKNVTIGISDADHAEIKEGLNGDETVRIERQGKAS